ncbi:glycosyltransferase family 4 protein [Aerococcus sp.]|uniref:glycosyltransferase family 4 protein n=1 Tax=Aerococcus sp. TaxID=1872398 RepID=UPI0028AD2EEF|nr:glycosyltransferase family 4 protein [Aerococcus sp.]
MTLSILYLTNIPSPYRVSFFNELGKLCDLTVIFERFQSTEREKDWHDYNFETFKAIFLKGIKVSSNKAFDLNIRHYLKDKQFDVIVIGNYSTPSGIFSINYLNSKKIPFLISVDGGLIDYEEGNFKKNLKTKLISSATAWLSTGEVTNQYLTYYGANEEQIHVYPFTTMKQDNIINHPLNKNEKTKLRTQLGIPYSNMVISVGQFIHRKGFDILIEASKRFKDNTGVYIIGGEPTEEYKELISHYSINNVYFLSFLEYEELKKYYLAADVFVFPTREDVWGLVINEAMANGLPVITTTSCVAGLEMIDEGINGYLVSKDDVEQLVEKTNEILSSEDLQHSMSLRSLETVQSYTIENMAETTVSIFKKIRKSS